MEELYTGTGSAESGGSSNFGEAEVGENRFVENFIEESLKGIDSEDSVPEVPEFPEDSELEAILQQEGIDPDADRELTSEEQAELDRIVSENQVQVQTPRSSYKIEQNTKLKASFDRDSGEFQYSFPNGSYFTLTAPLGGITNYAVKVRCGGGAYIRRYAMNNTRAEVKEANEFGKAVVSFRVDEVGGYDFFAETEYANGPVRRTYQNRSSFRIAKEGEPLDISFLRAPYGFRIGEVLIDGRQETVTNPDHMILTNDGEYTVTCVPEEVEEAIPWTFSFVRDTTAPYLNFSQDISQGVLNGEVLYTPSEPDAQVDIFLDGQQIYYNLDGLAASGDYRMEVSDLAGNTMEYDFSILNEHGTPPAFFGGVFLTAALLAVLIVLVSRKRRLPVR